MGVWLHIKCFIIYSPNRYFIFLLINDESRVVVGGNLLYIKYAKYLHFIGNSAPFFKNSSTIT